MNFLRCRHPNLQLAALLVVLGLLRCDSVAQRSKANPPSAGASAGTSSEDVGKRLLAVDTAAPDPPPALAAGSVVDKLMSTGARRSAELKGYRATRFYRLQYHGIFGTREASMKVIANFTAPDKHEFSVVEASGSKLLINRVLLKLLDSEREAYRNQPQIEISPANYQFESMGLQTMDGGPCYVLGVRPRQETKFLYRGKIWIDARDFALVQMQGEPARSPSFWVKDTQIDSRWTKVGRFWFIGHNRSVSHIRMGGLATLSIDYTDYQITAVGRTAGRSQNPELPDPSSVTPPR
jgi:hypothetical protein